MASLIQFAYDIGESELFGGPDWARRDRFEIMAMAPGGASEADRRAMVKTLLEERFSLMIRKEQRDGTFSVLLVASGDGRLGPRLRECDSAAPRNPSNPIQWPRGGAVSFRQCAPISIIAEVASRALGVSVVDGTGISGLWSYELTFLDPRSVSANVTGSSTAVVDPDLVPFSSALEEQLGLRVERRRGPIDVLVIESVQQPTED